MRCNTSNCASCEAYGRDTSASFPAMEEEQGEKKQSYAASTPMDELT